MRTYRQTVQRFTGAAAVLLLGVTSGTVHATFSSDFTFEPFNPDLFNSQLSLDYTYNAGDATSVLNVSSTSSSGSFTDVNGVETGILAMDFSLTTNFSGAGSTVESGNVKIYSKDPFEPLGIPQDSLLLGGTIYDFSIESKGDAAGTFYFLLENTYSDVADILGWGGGVKGQILFNAVFNDAPGWENGTVNFDSDGQIVPQSSSDTSVPAPAPVALLGAGLLAMRLVRRIRG